jgi:NTE family protein
MKNHSPESSGLVLALGSGGAPGLAHIGVLQVLAEHDIPVRAIVGCSVGAEIGAFIASGMSVDDLTTVATSFDWKDTLQLFMPDLPTGGLVSGVNIVDFLQSWIGVHKIEDLAMGYVAVATDIESGEQIALDSGDLVAAVRASISIPGFLAPQRTGKRLLVDGGVVNPLPFDVARERFGGPVLAVAVHSGARTRRPTPAHVPQWSTRMRQLLKQPWMSRTPALRAWLEEQLANHQTDSVGNPEWSARQVLERALDIMQVEIVRLRAASVPPDLMLVPEVSEIGLLEFYSAREAIAAGRAAAEGKLEEIKRLSIAAASVEDQVSQPRVRKLNR